MGTQFQCTLKSALFLSRRNSSTLYDEFQDEWKTIKLGDSAYRIYAYSAFYDNRHRFLLEGEGMDPVIRINVLAPKDFKTRYKNIYCVVKLQNNQIRVVRTSVLTLKEHFNLKYRSFFINCNLHEYTLPNEKLYLARNVTDFPNSMMKSDSMSVALISPSNFFNLSGKGPRLPAPIINVHIRKPPSYLHSSPENESEIDSETSLCVCVKPIYLDWNRAIWLVEFFEMYRLLGKNSNIKKRVFTKEFYIHST